MVTGAVTAATRRRPFWRSGAAASLAAALSTAGHLAGAGQLPSGTPVVLGLVAIAAAATGLAHWSGARRRRCWEALGLLWLGQLAAETLLICDSGELHRPLAAATVHAGAGLMAGVLLLGGRRLLDDTATAVDALLPPWWLDPPQPASPSRPVCRPGGTPVYRGLRLGGAGPVRGPPRPA